jgi:hypothetical protein
MAANIWIWDWSTGLVRGGYGGNGGGRLLGTCGHGGRVTGSGSR